MSKLQLKSNYVVESKYEAFFTGKHVQVTKDGSSLLCECDDAVGVLALATGKVSGKISCEDDVITCISLSPDNSSLIVALRSTSVQQYQWPSLELQRSFRSYHRGPITVMDWDRSSTLLITGAADSSARIWDLQQKFCTHSLKGGSGIFRSLLFHPDLTLHPYVYGAVDNNIHIWALAAGSSELKATLNGHHSAVTSVQMTADNTHLVSSGLDRVIILWDLKTFESKRIVPVMESLSGILLQPENSLFPGASTDDGHIYALTVGDKGIPSVWQVDNGRQVWKATAPLLTTPDKEGASLINQILFSPALESVIFTTYDHSILFSRINTLDVWKQLTGYNDQILDVVFVGVGDTHLVVATNSAQLRIYNVSDFSCHLTQGHKANVFSVIRHPTQHNIFASSSHDGSVRLWHLESDGSAACIGSAVGHTQGVGSVALSQKFMATGSNDMCLKRWDISKISEKKIGNNEIAFVSTHTERAHEKDINSLCISVNQKLIASGSQDKTAKIWDSSDLSLLGILRGHRRSIWCVQFSPVEEIVATSSADGTIKIWTLSDFSIALTLEGHDCSVMKLSWASQGQQMLSIGSDGLLKLWTIKTRQCVQTFDEHEDRLWALAALGDESRIVTGGEDAILIIWKDVTQEEKEKEAAEAARLAAEEQTLSNLIQDKKWAKALGIAIRLNQPFRALKIIKELLDEDQDQLPKVIKKFRHDQLVSILQFAVQWNTKTKNSREAQSVLNVVLSSHTPEELESMKEWQQLLEGLLPYTDRHFRRLSALHQASSILQYMSSSISLAEMPALGSTETPLNNLELLRSISDFPHPKESGSDDNADSDDEDEGVDVDEYSEEEKVPESIRKAVNDSVMEVSENDDDDEEEELDSEIQTNIDRLDEKEMMVNANRNAHGNSLDDLDANFIVEEVVSEKSSDEGEEEDNIEEGDKNAMESESFSDSKIKLQSKKNSGKKRIGKKKKSKVFT